ncbi:MAG: bifunctional glutamine synthetase adenylyltransferase/deadenyltransferase, partial [Propionivibrio sp.]|nr:bifunctional glutamine synthetase adenylyltransferase/deadenyltransferase [Propionivibrio sp.]
MTDTPESNSASFPAEWQPALAHSRYLRQLIESRPEIAVWLTDHADGALDSALMERFLQSEAPNDEAGLKRSLRRLRQRIMAALIVRDIASGMPLAEVVET